MIVYLDRNGPPEAMHCPVFVCDACGNPIQGDDKPGIVIWRSGPHSPDHRPGTQQMAHVHKGACDRAYEADHPGGHWSWNDLDEFLEHLTNNTAKPFPDEPDVEYVAPAPLTWRQGRYERKATR